MYLCVILVPVYMLSDDSNGSNFVCCRHVVLHNKRDVDILVRSSSTLTSGCYDISGIDKQSSWTSVILALLIGGRMLKLMR